MIFFWKKDTFFYNHGMSNFKTKKIQKTKITPDTPQASTEKSPRKTSKKLIGFLLFFVSIAFLANAGMEYVGSMRISDTPIIPFQTVEFSGSTLPAKEGTTNILIAGIGGTWHEWANLTDSIMLASIDPDAGYVTLLSIPRDLFVAYPKWYSPAGRINSLYGMWKDSGKWISYLAEKVSEITGQPIHHYLVIDFRGFKSVVDLLGGLEVDVPKDLIDREYPDNNWGYETFVVRAGKHTFDGETALKYVRSRHSTSDFDRSERQQLILKALKSKIIEDGFISNTEKISNLYSAIAKNIDSDLTVGDIAHFALKLKGIENNHINIYNLSNECQGIKCSPGAYLYTPSREYFGGAAAIIPENASATRLSYYDDIRRFVEFIFHYPNMKNEKIPLVFIYNKWQSASAKLLATNLSKMGISFDTNNIFVESTGSLIETSRVNIYWNSELSIGIDPESQSVKALKSLEEKIPYSIVNRNEYVTTSWPKIEIILGKDKSSYYTFAKPTYYLPYIESTQSGSTGSINASGSTSVSWEVKSANKVSKPKTSSPQITGESQKIQNAPTNEFSVNPGEWEEF